MDEKILSQIKDMIKQDQSIQVEEDNQALSSVNNTKQFLDVVQETRKKATKLQVLNPNILAQLRRKVKGGEM